MKCLVFLKERPALKTQVDLLFYLYFDDYFAFDISAISLTISIKKVNILFKSALGISLVYKQDMWKLLSIKGFGFFMVRDLEFLNRYVFTKQP